MLVNVTIRLSLILAVTLLSLPLGSFYLNAEASLNKQKFQERILTLRYNSQRMKGLYSNTKNLLRITDIPPEVNEVQVFQGDPMTSNVTMIGKRNREVITEPGSAPYVEFKFQIGNKGGKEFLHAKYFERDEYDGTFKVFSTTKIPINVRDCAKDVPNPLCGRPMEAEKCGINCYRFSPGELTNYENFCELNAAEAKLFAKGYCPIEIKEELIELTEL